MSMFWRVTDPRPKCCTRGPLISDLVDLLVRVCMHAFSARHLPFSLLHIQPKQPCGPPRSRLPPPCGPAGSHAHGNTQSGPYCSAASQPGRDPTSRKDEKKYGHGGFEIIIIRGKGKITVGEPQTS